MAPLGPFDKERIANDIVQAEELIARNEALLSIETDADQAELITDTLADLRVHLRTLKQYLVE